MTYPIRSSSFAAVAAVALLLFMGRGSHGADSPSQPRGNTQATRNGEVGSLFAGDEVLRISIEIPAKAAEKLRNYHWQPGADAATRESVQVTIREGTGVYTNVALHLKGAAGSFRPLDDRPAFTVNFDKFAPGQSFHGLRKLSLNNSVQDPTYVSEILCRELFLKAGVPVPRAAHAHVNLDGRDLGLYVLLEGWDKDFLRRHFKNGDGTLYDAGFLKDITDELSVNVGANTGEQKPRLALVQAAQEPDLSKRRAAFEKILDFDEFLSFIALDIMLWDWDGYAMNKNNWRLYHDVSRDRLVFMPHGLDQMFWKPEGSLLPPLGGVVARAALEIPELRKRYLDRVGELRRTVFDVTAMAARAGQLAARARPVLAAPERDDHERSVADLTKAIIRRGRSIDMQLERGFEPVAFDAGGLSTLTRWTARTNFGSARLEHAAQPAALHVSAGDGSSIGTWRTALWLRSGHYRFEGRVRTRGVVADPGDPRAGVGLRGQTTPSTGGVLGDSDWHEVGCDLEVTDVLSEVSLLCEFRGMAGEAWFDESSLRVRQLPGQGKPAGN